MALATLPILWFGWLSQDVLEIDFRSAEIVAWSFIVWGSVLYLIDRRATTAKDRVQEVGLKRALFVGLAQAIAIIPGTSRSGITMTAGLATGLSRETAARFSFLLSIPTIAVAGFYKLGEVVSGKETVELLPLAVGFVVAMVSAFLTVRFLLKFLQRSTFSQLAIFRVLVGLVILLLL
jgi:undecaprenyl-diphosphatase